MLLSVLIATLQSRSGSFSLLFSTLKEQIRSCALEQEVEVLYCRDQGEQSIGQKRNLLLERAGGAFVSFVDDDDQVSPDYVRLICDAVRANPRVDCLGIRGVITFRGTHPRELVYSVRYHDMFSRDHTYYRPPAHLNPIRRDIATRYRFPDVSYSEDFDWALRMRDDGALKQEISIDPVLYYYRSRRWWPYQLMLDQTEGIRHRMGIRMVNRLRFLHGRRPADPKPVHHA